MTSQRPSLTGKVNLEVTPELVKQAQTSDPQALNDLVEASYRQAYTLAYRLLGNRDDASEATQEAFIRVVRALKRLDEPNAYFTWMFRIVSNVCMTQLRRRSRSDIPSEIEPERDPNPVDIEDLAVDRVLEKELHDMVAALPEAYRSVIVLRDIYGFSGAEAATALGTTEGAIKVRLLRARRKLRADILETHPDWAPDSKESA